MSAVSDRTHRVVAGALRSAIHDHGPIDENLINSATKRIVAQIRGAAESVLQCEGDGALKTAQEAGHKRYSKLRYAYRRLEERNNQLVRQVKLHYGEPHILVLHSFEPPTGQFDDGDMEYEIEHPPSCEQVEVRGFDGETWLTWDNCEIQAELEHIELPFTLKYSGTPITEPGRYRVQSWHSRSYIYEYGYEYDGGIGVMDYDNGNKGKLPARELIEKYVAYIQAEANGTILGQWVCVDPPSLAEYERMRLQ